MAAPSNPLVELSTELLEPLGRVRSRRMFGGHGFYVDDVFLALITGERLYLKVDDSTRAQFERAGCEPFAFDTKDGERVVLGYWSVPAEAMESPALMQPWARLALAAALRAKAAKPASARRKPAAAAPAAAATVRKGTPSSSRRKTPGPA